MIISLVQQKGGVGKTTLALNIADCLSRRGASVVVIDSDPQGSATHWMSLREGTNRFDVAPLPKATLRRTIDRYGQGRDFVIFDSAPRVADMARHIIIASHVALVPISPGPFDVWSARGTVDLIRQAQMFQPDLKGAFIINRQIVHTTMSRNTVEALQDLGLPTLAAAIRQRVIFAESAMQGKTVTELDGRSPAVAELEALTDEILTLAGLSGAPNDSTYPAMETGADSHGRT